MFLLIDQTKNVKKKKQQTKSHNKSIDRSIRMLELQSCPFVYEFCAFILRRNEVHLRPNDVYYVISNCASVDF